MPDTLPSWSLADLYSSASDDNMTRDMADCRDRASALASTWKSRLHEADAASLAGVIEDYQAISETLGRLSSFADLAFAADMSEAETGRMAQSMRELESEISAQLVFVELEIARIEDDHMDALMQSDALASWSPWLRIVRAWRKHQLSDELETMLIERSPSGRAAWVATDFQ